MTYPHFFSFACAAVCLSLAACSPSEPQEDAALLSEQELNDVDAACRASGRHATDSYCQQVAALKSARLIELNRRKIQEQATRERATNVPSVPLY
jgi:hypothetical protein